MTYLIELPQEYLNVVIKAMQKQVYTLRLEENSVSCRMSPVLSQVVKLDLMTSENILTSLRFQKREVDQKNGG